MKKPFFISFIGSGFEDPEHFSATCIIRSKQNTALVRIKTLPAGQKKPCHAIFSIRNISKYNNGLVSGYQS
jgi:hypothetical protein